MIKDRAVKIFVMTQGDFNLLRNYVIKCNNEGFVGINNFKRIQNDREIFYRWHLDLITKKIGKKQEGDRRWLNLTFPEILTLQAMFKRVDCCKEMIEIQRRFYYI